MIEPDREAPQALPETLSGRVGVEVGTETTEPSRWSTVSRSFLRRIVHWSPVVISMVLFSQVSFLGLRPAWCERRRLIEAEAMMEARHTRDVVLRDSIQRSLRARSDPIFLERQRRMRLQGPVLAQR